MNLLDINYQVRRETKNQKSRFVLSIPSILVRTQQVRKGDKVIKLIIGDYEFPVNSTVRKSGNCFVITVPSYLIHNNVVFLGDVVRYIDLKRKV